MAFYLRKGLMPDALRPKVWLYIINISNFKKVYSKQLFQNLIDQKSTVDVCIQKDVPRTFPDMQFF